ncbi:globin domain-containing protein [Streptomyces sp. 1222.5]|uniref:globin domain-containing protein n=1 Tax=Streptomyces sp. 1222.5 TaxID=1881026 RepID=UPI003EB83D9B
MISYFYALVFLRHPELRVLFPLAMNVQRDRFVKALLRAAEHIGNIAPLIPYLQSLGRSHRTYGVLSQHYPAVGQCLVDALARYARLTWGWQTEAAWQRAYATLSQVMISAAAEEDRRTPPWWQAEVIVHQLITSDIAVIILRPNHPYPFLAGQHAMIETPWWPRIWRHYSFASAPCTDGLLTLHVKAVPAGWVSNSLVRRAKPGDVIRVGRPEGTMTVDHTTDTGLLCVAGGTGIAPIQALVQDVVRRNERRPIEVFYGASADRELYALDTMLQLRAIYPWLSIHSVTEQRNRMQLPYAVDAYGPWNGYDVYLSGPPGMIRTGLRLLQNGGVPPERIKHDWAEERCPRSFR